MSGEPEHPPVPEQPPSTGVRQVDDALADITTLADVPLAEHHDRLAQAHAALSEAMADSRSGDRGASVTQVSGDRNDPARP